MIQGHKVTNPLRYRKESIPVFVIAQCFSTGVVPPPQGAFRQHWGSLEAIFLKGGHLFKTSLYQRFTMRQVETCNFLQKNVVCNIKTCQFTPLQLDNTVFCFHSINSLLQCFVSFLQCSSMLPLQESSIKNHQHSFYCVNSGKWTLFSLVFPMEEMKSFFLLKAFVSPEDTL